MFEEGKRDSPSDIMLLVEAADCDRLEQWLSAKAQRATPGLIDYLFLAFCEKFQGNNHYENCLKYMLP